MNICRNILVLPGVHAAIDFCVYFFILPILSAIVANVAVYGGPGGPVHRGDHRAFSTRRLAGGPRSRTIGEEIRKAPGAEVRNGYGVYVSAEQAWESLQSRVLWGHAAIWRRALPTTIPWRAPLPMTIYLKRHRGPGAGGVPCLQRTFAGVRKVNYYPTARRPGCPATAKVLALLSAAIIG